MKQDKFTEDECTAIIFSLQLMQVISYEVEDLFELDPTSEDKLRLENMKSIIELTTQLVQAKMGGFNMMTICELANQLSRAIPVANQSDRYKLIQVLSENIRRTFFKNPKLLIVESLKEIPHLYKLGTSFMRFNEKQIEPTETAFKRAIELLISKGNDCYKGLI